MLYSLTNAVAFAVNVDRVSPLPSVVGVFLFWLVIFFGLVLSMKIQVELRLIAKGFIFEVSSQSLKRREAENYGGDNQSMRAARWSLNRVTYEKSGKYRNELQYELSFLSLLIYSCTAVSYPSLFSRTCLVTLYYWYEMNSEQYLNWAFKDQKH